MADALPKLDRARLRKRLLVEFERVVEEVSDAIDEAPAGRVIRDSEEKARDTLDRFRQVVYEQALQGKSGERFTNNARQEYTYTYHETAERATMQKLYDLITAKMDGVTIEMIGTWIWVSGNTRRYKDLLGKNGLGLRFSGKRKMWYFTTTRKRGGRYSRKSMDDLRNKYGARTFQVA